MAFAWFTRGVSVIASWTVLFDVQGQKSSVLQGNEDVFLSCSDSLHVRSSACGTLRFDLGTNRVRRRKWQVRPKHILVLRVELYWMAGLRISCGVTKTVEDIRVHKRLFLIVT